MASDKEGTNVEVYIENVRLSHPHLWQATTYKGDKNAKPKFQASFIIDPKVDAKAHGDIWDAIEDVQEAKWDDKEFCENDKLPYTDGNKKNKKKPRPEYVDRWILTAKNDRRPQVLDRDKTPLTRDDPKPYAGCRVDALVRIYALDNEWGDRVNCSLEIVRFHKDDTAFGPEPADPDNMPDLPQDGERSNARALGRGRGREDGERGRGRETEDRGERGRGSSESNRGGRGDDRGSGRGRGAETVSSGGRGRGDDTPRRGSRDDGDAPREQSSGRRRAVSTDDVV